MFIIKLSLLFLSTIGTISCSKKEEGAQSNPTTYQVRVLQEAAQNQFQARNVTTDLGINDLIYLDSNTAGVFSYNPQETFEGFRVRANSECNTENGSRASYQTSFQNRKIKVLDLLPPQTLNSLLNSHSTSWDCTFKIEFIDPTKNSYRVIFKNKKILVQPPSTFPLLYDVSAIPFSNNKISELDFKNLTLSKLLSGQSIELICENFSSLFVKSNSEVVLLSNLTHHTNLNTYRTSSLDPRIQKPSQKCILRQTTPHNSMISDIFHFQFMSAKPNLACEIHQRSFGAGMQTRVASLYYQNPYEFPITVARDVRTQYIFVNIKGTSGGSREHDGSLVNRNELMPVSLSIPHSLRKTFGSYEYFWIPPQARIEIQVHIQPSNLPKSPTVTVHHLNDICKVILLSEIFETFEELREVEIYTDPN
jgi:hypothetical protein